MRKKVKNKIFYIGDFNSNTGPANANRNFIKGLSNSIYICKKNNKIIKFIDTIIHIAFSDAICICGFFRSSNRIIKIAKLFNKKIFYIMHGWIKNENKINLIDNDDEKYENYILNNANKIYCVSELFANKIKENYPELKGKIDFIYNGIDFDKINSINKKENKKENNLIMTTGGGIPLKNNYIVCKAIKKLNDEYNLNLKFLILGPPSKDIEKITEYDFVEYHNVLSYEETINYMNKSKIYIQNSDFETFGLAVIEAVIQNCQILISKNVGAIGIIDEFNKKMLIENVKNEEEIAKKILELIKNENKEIYSDKINKEVASARARSSQLYKKMIKEINK